MVTKEEIRKNIQIIALNNLIEDYTSFLEVCKNPSERELTEKITYTKSAFHILASEPNVNAKVDQTNID